MAAPFRKRDLAWLPTIVVLAVVLLGGSRLLYLSVQHHSELARINAANVGLSYARKIEPELQRLADLAVTQARAAAQTFAADEQADLNRVPLKKNTFWMSAEDRVIGARQTEMTAATGVASEWQSAESARPVPGQSMLGPLRLGSQWLMAARVPIRSRSGEERPRGWAVAYADLDALLAGAHLSRLGDEGFDFELLQAEPRSARNRIFVGSSTEPLLHPAVTQIRLPAGFAPAVPGSYLAITLRPHSGWYPTTELASDIGLLAFLA
ncbi:MAG: hypothetical protein JOZ93_10030, partial [Sinobacteraceae bacterium]|nr:hypothetical protein [Nevskiaceae bacterium]